MRGPPSVRVDGNVIIIDEEDPKTTVDVDMNNMSANDVDVSRLNRQGESFLGVVQQSS